MVVPEVTNELMDELSKRMRRDMPILPFDMGEIRSELGSIRGRIAAMNGDIHDVYGVPGRRDLRLDRIERRLEQREWAEPTHPHDPGA